VYRSSPLEKAEVVKFVKGQSNQFTLAIGDGGNDVNMIQSASIGVGIIGKEGNQAANFSDYAIPNFQGINRLVFCHGMQFGQKMIIFMIPLNLFKATIYISGTFIANFFNGYSGVALFKGFYYSLHPVTLTTITVCTFLYADISVSRNPNKYTRDSTQSEAHTSPTYNPTKRQPFGLLSVFNREDWLSQNGISTNSDGSTNNLTDYFQWVRDTWVKNLPYYYAVNMLWGFLCGFILFFFTFYSMSGIILSNGYTNDYWNTGFVVFFTLITTHHMLMWSETRNFNWFVVSFYLLTALLFRSAIKLSDGGKNEY
jgi:magnesium-transporting ATPase (P-type)